ncbi:MAG TPA: alpha/beta hydrolase [Candidatus Saccharimonas sp.]|jgi:predicted alpha/beta hydrolase family esterase|nr:alpha/beta hydrolase [Candidatus Saccharimonas sp.]
MKRAVILHGTDGGPDLIWIPWLKQKLEAEGYEVWAPLLPENHTPNRKVYNDFLFGQGWDFTDNIVVGHSSGAVEVLNLLMDDRCPRVKMAVMVGVWAGGVPNGYGEGSSQFDNLFSPEGFDFGRIKNNAEHIALLHGDNDPFCPLEQAEYIATQLDVPLTIVPGGGHLGRSYPELPELWEVVASGLDFKQKEA